jgi:hypothetical protein
MGLAHCKLHSLGPAGIFVEQVAKVGGILSLIAYG